MKKIILLALCLLLLLAAGCQKEEEPVTEPQWPENKSTSPPLIAYWVELGPLEDPVMEDDESFSIGVAFGSHGKGFDYFEIAVDAPDFVAEYPEKIVVDGVNFTKEDYHVPQGGSTTYKWLPVKFTLTLTRTPKDEVFSNAVRVEVTASSENGGSGARKTVEFYYYGGPDKVCFSAVSPTEAQELYENAK